MAARAGAPGPRGRCCAACLEQLVERLAVAGEKLCHKVRDLGHLRGHLVHLGVDALLGGLELGVSGLRLVDALDECRDLVGGPSPGGAGIRHSSSAGSPRKIAS